MITVLLEKIITILEGWIQSFTSHAQHVEDKLDSLDQTASDIETNTEPISDIADNTGAVVTPIQNIKSNTDSIATSSQTSANNTTAILNNVSTLSTNTGRAAAYAQDCANNTLEIKDKITTIASDTTQLRADNANIAADVSSINQAISYYVANTPVTEDSEGALCNIDTDLEDYLQKCKVNIPADLTGFSGITLYKRGKNFIDDSIKYAANNTAVYIGTNSTNYTIYLLPGVYTVSADFNNVPYGMYYRKDTDSTNRAIWASGTGTTSAQITITESGLYRFWVFRSDGAGGVDPNNILKVMVEYGDTVTEYEPYKVLTYPVSFGSTITDGAEVDLLSGLVKVNTTPVSFIQIQPIAVRTYKGVNNIYSDIGTSALTYRETLKHYLDKNNQ